MPKSRNLRLAPIQNDILWELEEAGAEELWDVWIAVRGKHPAMPEESIGVEFVEGVFSLERLGFLQAGRNLYKPENKIPLN